MDERKQMSSEQLKEGNLKQKYVGYFVCLLITAASAHLSTRDYENLKKQKWFYLMESWKHNEHYHWMQKDSRST